MAIPVADRTANLTALPTCTSERLWSQVSDPELDCGITTAAFHPDGVILGTGCQDTMVRVWEVRQQKVWITTYGAACISHAHLKSECLRGCACCRGLVCMATQS